MRSHAPSIIQAKVKVPPISDRIVSRPRLDERLIETIQTNRVVALIAMAGSGKTTAMAAAAERFEWPVTWLSVDRTEVAPGRLVSYLEAALAQQLPNLKGAATDGLGVGLDHAETAGLLAEAVGEDPLVLVLDNLERLDESEEAWTVIESLVRYASPGLKLVLISRQQIPTRIIHGVAAGTPVPTISEAHLAFTPAEAHRAFGLLDRPKVDPTAAVEATGGWAAGVLFEAWRAENHLSGNSDEIDPLHGYLAEHIIGQLDQEERDFLVATSLLDEVTPVRAEAIGQTEAARHLTNLRAAHLPVTWLSHRLGMRCHPRFREYLLECLESQPPDEVAALRRAYGCLLAAEGLYEEATEELLQAGAVSEALEPSGKAIVRVIERLDFDIADRWLEQMAEVSANSGPLTVARLMLAIGREDFRECHQLADQLSTMEERDRLAASDEYAAALMAWCYLSVGQLDNVRTVLDLAPDGPSVAAVRHCMRGVENAPGRSRPSRVGGPLDALISRADYMLGRLDLFDESRASRWVEIAQGPYHIAALRAKGETQVALERYESAIEDGGGALSLQTYLGPEILIDAGRIDEARVALARGAELANASGSVWFPLFNGLAEAKFLLRVKRDPVAGRALLDRLSEALVIHPFQVVKETLDMWFGFTELIEGDSQAAVERLTAAMESMYAGDRLLEVPTCMVYLSEARWQVGDYDGADEAADLALQAARRQGSNHALLLALRDFPAVLSRRLDAESEVDSDWHGIGRALSAQGVAVKAQVKARVLVREFGSVLIEVDGEEVRPRLAKCQELLAYLLTLAEPAATRAQLLEVLFDGRADDSTRSYLRQVVHQARRIMPDQIGLEAENGSIRLTGDVAASSESALFAEQLSEAARLHETERLAATMAALEIYDRGDYLPALDSPWVGERRAQLDDLATNGRHEAAELEFAAGRYQEAGRLAERVLEADPLRESTWRLSMRVAAMLGDTDRVLATFEACRQRLAEIGTSPSAETSQLVERLRR